MRPANSAARHSPTVKASALRTPICRFSPRDPAIRKRIAGSLASLSRCTLRGKRRPTILGRGQWPPSTTRSGAHTESSGCALDIQRRIVGADVLQQCPPDRPKSLCWQRHGQRHGQLPNGWISETVPYNRRLRCGFKSHSTGYRIAGHVTRSGHGLRFAAHFDWVRVADRIIVMEDERIIGSRHPSHPLAHSLSLASKR